MPINNLPVNNNTHVGAGGRKLASEIWTYVIQIRCRVIRNMLMILLFALNTHFPRNWYFDDMMMRCMKHPRLPVHFNLFVFLPPPSFTVSNLFILNAPSFPLRPSSCFTPPLLICTSIVCCCFSARAAQFLRLCFRPWLTYTGNEISFRNPIWLFGLITLDLCIQA